MKDKSFSVTDAETIAEYKAEVWRLKKELEIRDTTARSAMDKNEALAKDVDYLTRQIKELKSELNDLIELCKANNLHVTSIKCWCKPEVDGGHVNQDA